MDKVVVLDFGGQYAHLIANRIRRLGVYCEVKPNHSPAEKLLYYRGIILSGGPNSVYEHHAPTCDPKIFQLGVPVLGICYGHQLMAHMLGGQVEGNPIKEYGPAELEIKNPVGIFEGLTKKKNEKLPVWMSHGDSIKRLPDGFVEVGYTSNAPYAAIAHPKRQLFGTQFHVEVTHTPIGRSILENFLTVARCRRNWNIEHYIQFKIEQVKRFVRNKKVFMLMSGGVDSTVAFLLLKKALGEDNIHGLFVDTGFLRLHEAKEVEETLRSKLGFTHLHVYDGKTRFFDALKNVYDAEQKRRIIGGIFLDIKDEVAKKLGLDERQWLLGQGTIYPDTIESGGTQHADRIKTHHNRVDRITELIRRRRIVEPLKQFYKDEVRKVAEQFGLESSLINRHPFPGPGLAVRTLCVKAPIWPDNHVEVERQINILLSETEMKGRILPIKSVGVQGDSRTYRHPLALTGDTDWEQLERLSTDLTNQFSEINRVVYVLGLSEIENIEVVPGYLTEDRINMLQEIDHIVMKIVMEKGLENDIWQFPTILTPLRINGKGTESVVLRPVCSTEAMTANFAKLDWKVVYEIKQAIEQHDYVSAVMYDVTNKPPGTIEWE